MFTRILNDEESKRFSDITGIRANKIFINKNKKYYYATIVDSLVKIRISNNLASKFI